MFVPSATEAVVSGGAIVAGILLWGHAWTGQTVAVPVGWLLVGAIALLFVPALAIVTAISRRLGVQIEVKDTND